MAASKKLEEALEHIRAAEKSLKTSLLKWKADYDTAADEYNQAAACFRAVKSYQQCKECLIKAAECYKQNRSLFSAGKCYDQAALVCKDMGDLKEVATLAEQACLLYREHGSPDTGAISLDKSAKMIEGQYPERALNLYKRAAEVVSIEDRPRQASEYVSKISRIMVKLQMYDQAADSIRREIGLHQQSENLPAIGRLTVALVLVQLARGDYVAAEKAFRELGNCCEREEVQTLEQLLQGFDEEDPDMARRALNSPFIRHMDVEYSRLARDLPLPAGIVQPPKPSVREHAAPSYVSPKASSVSAAEAEGGPEQEGGESEEKESEAAPDEDEFSGGLC